MNSILFPNYFDTNISKNLLNKNRDRILANYLKGHFKNKIPELYIENIKDWDKTLLIGPSGVWHFQTLERCLGALLHIFNYNEECNVYLEKQIVNWSKWEKGVDEDRRKNLIWSRHATAIRLEFLSACFFIANFKNQGYLIDLIDEHIDFTENIENYDGNWNHGLDQNIALLKSYIVLNKPLEKKEFIYNRLLENLFHAFDCDGVTNEQAIGYHHYNVYRYESIIPILKSASLDTRDFENKIKKAYTFLNASLLPNGTYTPIGDTDYNFLNTNFVISNQSTSKLVDKICKDSEIETKKHIIFENSGYIFGRNSWEYKADTKHFSIRFGPARIIHGHNDHTSLTYYSNYKSIIMDGGFSGYNDDSYRAYLRSPNAHNVVFAENISKFLWDETTKLNYFKNITSNIKYYELEDKPYIGVIRKRQILINLDDDTVIVQDFILSEKEDTFIQNWNINSDFNVSIEDSYIVLKDKTLSYHVIYDKNSDEINIFKNNIKITNGNVIIKGGIIGYGHNDIRECNALQFVKTGKKLVFKTIFTNSKNTLVQDTNLEILEIVGKYYYLDDKIYIYKVQDTQEFHLDLNNPTDYTIFLKKEIELDSNAILQVDESLDYPSQNKYFYIKTISKNKLRFNQDIMLKPGKINVEFPIVKHSRAEIVIRIKILKELYE